LQAFVVWLAKIRATSGISRAALLAVFRNRIVVCAIEVALQLRMSVWAAVFRRHIADLA
jgi:hypothetical protein